jgi:hypothetical protein
VKKVASGRVTVVVLQHRLYHPLTDRHSGQSNGPNEKRHDLFVSFNLRTIEAACRNLHRAALTVHVHLHVPDPDDVVGRLLGVPKQRTDPFTQRKELKSTSIGCF